MSRKSHTRCLTAFGAICLWQEFIDLKGTIYFHYTTAVIQLSIFMGSVSFKPYKVCVISLRTCTAVGCIIMKRSFPARDKVKPVIISQIGPRYSRGPQSESSFRGDPVIHASRAPQAFVVPLDMGKLSSVSPDKPASLILSIFV